MPPGVGGAVGTADGPGVGCADAARLGDAPVTGLAGTPVRGGLLPVATPPPVAGIRPRKKPAARTVPTAASATRIVTRNGIRTRPIIAALGGSARAPRLGACSARAGPRRRATRTP